jgi:SAM-dependent methyltransferase
VSSTKYSGRAERWTEDAYADAASYLAHRAELVVSLGPPLVAGDAVVDLACGDGGLAAHLAGLRYVGVDADEAMVAAARRRGVDARLGDLKDFAPEEPVAAATIFRAIYYAGDRRELFRRIAGYVEKKLVFDLNPRQYRLEDVRADLRAAGFDSLALRPFFVPQTVRPPRAVLAALVAAERVRPLAALALRRRFTLMCSASRARRA